MTATYAPTLPTPRDRARLLLGDTGVDGNVFLLTDAEITATLGRGSFNHAVADLADALAVRFAQYPDDTSTPGGHKMRWSARVTAWQEIAKRLRAASGRRSSVYLGVLTNPAGSKLR